MHNLNFDSWSIVLLAGLISFGWLQFHSVKYAWTSNTVYSNIPAKAGCARCEQQNSIFYWKLANRKAHRLPILCIGYTIPAAHRHSPTQTKCEWWRFAFHDLHLNASQWCQMSISLLNSICVNALRQVNATPRSISNFLSTTLCLVHTISSTAVYVLDVY